jgi:SSS family solute:Na+ symporter
MEKQSIWGALANNGFTCWDYGVFALYIIILVIMGILLSRGKKETSKDYFLAGGSLTWWAVGASLIAANISAEHFIGMSGTAYKSGIAMAAYELMAAVTLVVLAKFILPLMIQDKVFTIPQFLRNRYNKGTGLAFSIFWLFLYIFIQMTSVSWLGALATKQILGLPSLEGSILGMSVDYTLLGIIFFLFLIAAIYSIYGGLTSVAWTDVIQVVFLIGGGLITTFAVLSIIAKTIPDVDGALSALGHIKDYLAQDAADRHFNLVVSRNPEAFPSILNDPYFDIPGIVVIVGGLWLTNLGYWGFNQFIIQKGLAAKSISEAKKGLVFAAFLKILIPFIVCIPGVCAYYVMNAPECEALRATLVGSITRSDDAYPFLIRNFTPIIIKGLSFAALSAAVISSLASMINSTSTIFTMDIYRQYINKNASEKKLVHVGRLTAVCAMIAALVAVYPIVGSADQAFLVIQEYCGFVYPGITVIFSLGLLWKRASGRAAVVTAIATFVLSTIFKFALPEVPFLLRMGYVFMCLAVLFISISLTDKNTRAAAPQTESQIRAQMKWSKILLAASLTCYITGCASMFSEYCRNYGFEAIFFFATMLLVSSIYLRSNAKDKVEDIKSMGIDLAAFRTDKYFNYGALCIMVIITILYACFW